MQQNDYLHACRLDKSTTLWEPCRDNFKVIIRKQKANKIWWIYSYRTRPLCSRGRSHLKMRMFVVAAGGRREQLLIYETVCLFQLKFQQIVVSDETDNKLHIPTWNVKYTDSYLLSGGSRHCRWKFLGQLSHLAIFPVAPPHIQQLSPPAAWQKTKKQYINSENKFVVWLIMQFGQGWKCSPEQYNPYSTSLPPELTAAWA